MTLTMLNSGEKSTEVAPTYVVTAPTCEQAPSGGGRVQKKHVLIAVSVVAIVGLVIAGIMIGMYMFSETQKEIIKFSLQFKASDNEKANQDVVSDPNDNVVMYHVTKPGQDINVVQDFNRDLQVVKIETPEGTNCYISALNRSQASDPSKITGPVTLTGSGDAGQGYSLSDTPVKDTTFLTKKARDMCQGVSTYWAYRSCGQQPGDSHNLNKTTSLDRNKRTLYQFNDYNGLKCYGGCCYIYCACEVYIVETVYANGVHHCDYYYRTGTCCSTSSDCNSYYVFYWYTPGLVC